MCSDHAHLLNNSLTYEVQQISFSCCWVQAHGASCLLCVCVCGGPWRMGMDGGRPVMRANVMGFNGWSLKMSHFPFFSLWLVKQVTTVLQSPSDLGEREMDGVIIRDVSLAHISLWCDTSGHPCSHICSLIVQCLVWSVTCGKAPYKNRNNNFNNVQ